MNPLKFANQGYTSIDGIDFANNANNSFFMIGHTNYGKYNLMFITGDLIYVFRVYLTNSVWHNNVMNGYYTSSLPYFEVKLKISLSKLNSL